MNRELPDLPAAKARYFEAKAAAEEAEREMMAALFAEYGTRPRVIHARYYVRNADHKTERARVACAAYPRACEAMHSTLTEWRALSEAYSRAQPS